MSTYFGFYCQNCNKSSAHRFNHGENLLREIYERRFEILRLQNCQWIEVVILGHGDSDVLEFINEHSVHSLYIESESGERIDLAAETVEKAKSFLQMVESAADSFDGEFDTTVIAGRIKDLFPEYANQNTPVGKWLIARELNKLRKKGRVELLRRNEFGVRGGSVNIYLKTPQW